MEPEQDMKKQKTKYIYTAKRSQILLQAVQDILPNLTNHYPELKESHHLVHFMKAEASLQHKLRIYSEALRDSHYRWCQDKELKFVADPMETAILSNIVKQDNRTINFVKADEEPEPKKKKEM